MVVVTVTPVAVTWLAVIAAVRSTSIVFFEYAPAPERAVPPPPLDSPTASAPARDSASISVVDVAVTSITPAATTVELETDASTTTSSIVLKATAAPIAADRLLLPAPLLDATEIATPPASAVIVRSSSAATRTLPLLVVVMRLPRTRDRVLPETVLIVTEPAPENDLLLVLPVATARAPAMASAWIVATDSAVTATSPATFQTTLSTSDSTS